MFNRMPRRFLFQVPLPTYLLERLFDKTWGWFFIILIICLTKTEVGFSLFWQVFRAAECDLLLSYITNKLDKMNTSNSKMISVYFHSSYLVRYGQ